MTTLTADEAMLAVLRQANGLAEIRDTSGAVVGFYAPVTLEHAAQFASAAAHIDPAELKCRRESTDTCYTTREVFERLRSLTPDEEMRAYLQKKIDGLAERDGCATP